jgi:hypothetical protein
VAQELHFDALSLHLANASSRKRVPEVRWSNYAHGLAQCCTNVAATPSFTARTLAAALNPLAEFHAEFHSPNSTRWPHSPNPRNQSRSSTRSAMRPARIVAFHSKAPPLQPKY